MAKMATTRKVSAEPIERFVLLSAAPILPTNLDRYYYPRPIFHLILILNDVLTSFAVPPRCMNLRPESHRDFVAMDSDTLG